MFDPKFRVVKKRTLDTLREERDRMSQEIIQAGGRKRVGCLRLNPEELTAQLRGLVDPSLRVEYDGYKFTIYADRLLEDAEVNRVWDIILTGIDRT